MHNVTTETADTQSTYHMYVENSRSGIMKRSGLDVDVISDVQTLPIYSVSTRYIRLRIWDLSDGVDSRLRPKWPKTDIRRADISSS